MWDGNACPNFKVRLVQMIHIHTRQCMQSNIEATNLMRCSACTNIDSHTHTHKAQINIKQPKKKHAQL